MEINEYEKMFKDEEYHWWYRTRRYLAKDYLEKEYKGNKKGNLRILDIASACGANFIEYKSFGNIIGVDISSESIKFCKQRGIKNIVQGDSLYLSFKDESFDIIIAFDALEHFENDIQALKEFKRVLKSNGKLIINVPALMSLWSQHDIAYHHVRRYDKHELIQKLSDSSYKIEKIFYWTFLLFIPLFIFRKIRSLFHFEKEPSRSDFYIPIPKIIENLFYELFYIERLLISRDITFPIGSSLFVIVKK